MIFFGLFIRVFTLFLMMFSGFFLRYVKMIDERTTHILSRLFMRFFYPCLIFTFLVGNFDISAIKNNFVLPLGAFFIMLIGYFVGFIAIKFIKFDNDKQKYIFNFQCLLNNYSFLPLPLILMFFGEKVASKHLFATMGAEIAVWTLGIFCLTGDKFSKKFLKNLISPPMLSILFSFLFIFIRDNFVSKNLPFFITEFSSALFFVMDMFGKATVPIAMVVAGSRMFGIKLVSFANIQYVYLSILRLIVIPFICFYVISLFDFSSDIRNILLIISIMPVAVTSIVFADIFNSDTEFASESVLITHIFSLITIPIWLSFIL